MGYVRGERSIKKRDKVEITLAILLIFSIIWMQNISLLPTQNVFAAKRTGLMYVANYFSESISVINTNISSVVLEIELGSIPGGMAFDPIHDRMYVTLHNGSVAVVDPNLNGVRSHIAVAGGAQGIAFDSTHNKMYVSGSDTVSVIDTNKYDRHSDVYRYWG
jgi:YVTN family beta-propeller protein